MSLPSNTFNIFEVHDLLEFKREFPFLSFFSKSMYYAKSFEWMKILLQIPQKILNFYSLQWKNICFCPACKTTLFVTGDFHSLGAFTHPLQIMCSLTRDSNTLDSIVLHIWRRKKKVAFFGYSVLYNRRWSTKDWHSLSTVHFHAYMYTQSLYSVFRGKSLIFISHVDA